MNVTFLVEISLDDLSSITTVADEINDDLSATFEVVSVKPWARPSGNPLAALPNLTEIAPPTL